MIDYLNIFKKLNEKKIRYILAGGIAVNLHGIPRMTYDIDLIVDLEDRNLQNITIPTVSIDDLIKMKQKSGREQDKADIKYLKRLKNEKE